MEYLTSIQKKKTLKVKNSLLKLETDFWELKKQRNKDQKRNGRPIY